MKALYKKLRRFFVRSERRNLGLVMARVDRSCRVLEVGAGFGAKQGALKTLGFTNVRGVEINPESAAHARSLGHDVVDLESFERDEGGRKFDVLFLSHIIEHFSPDDLIRFMNHWLERVEVGGRVVIATPLAGPFFWNDLDHVKPYTPQGVLAFFGQDQAQVSVRSGHSLRLDDIRYRRSPLRLANSRGEILKKGDAPVHAANIFLLAAYAATGGLIGRTDGWIGLFTKVS